MYKAYLVDDEELILDELESVIPWMDNGFDVIGSLTNPKDAVMEILELKPDVVFCDLKMPEMDGLTLIETLKAKGADCEFVMISAYDSYDNVRAFFQNSGFDYVLKPVQIDDMQLVLERLVMRLSSKKNMEEEPLCTNNRRFDELVSYVDGHFDEKITLDMLAKKYNFSKNYICNLFAKYFNTSLTCYLTKKRMLHAKELLEDKSILMKEVAAECGYGEYVHFFKVFKEYYGVSPKEVQGKSVRYEKGV